MMAIRRHKKDDDVIIRVRVPRKGEVLGEIEQLLGDRRMNVRCSDGHTRLCRIPGKQRRRIFLHEGDIVLVEKWEVQENERGDILMRYYPQQVDWLRRRKFLENLE